MRQISLILTWCHVLPIVNAINDKNYLGIALDFGISLLWDLLCNIVSLKILPHLLVRHKDSRCRVCSINLIQWIFASVFMNFQLKMLCQTIEREHFPFLLIFYSLCHHKETFFKLVAQHNLSLVEINLWQIKAAGMCAGAALVPWCLMDRHLLNLALKSITNICPFPQAAVIPLTIWVLPQMYFSRSFPALCTCNPNFLSKN